MKIPVEYLSEKDEAIAVRAVRAKLKACDNKKWVHILDFRITRRYGFFIVCELFPKKLYPKHLSAERFATQQDYYKALQEETWDTSHMDIGIQKGEGAKGPVYKIQGFYDPFVEDKYSMDRFIVKRVTRLGFGEEVYEVDDWY